MAKRKKTKKKKQVNQVSGAILTPEKYARLVKESKEKAREEEMAMFKEQLRKGTSQESYEIQEESERRRQKLIEQKLKSALARGEEREARRQVEFAVKTPIQRAFTRVSPGVRKLDTKVGAVVRKAVHLLAPKGGMVRRITAPPSKKVSGRGRGRPRKTYKTRVLPSGKVVKVPTHVYKKMLAQEKAAIRLAQAQRQAIMQQQAEEIAMQQDPRYQPTAEDAWADSEDMEHETEVQRIKQQQLLRQQLYQQQQMQQPSPIRRAGEMFGKARFTLMGGRQQPPVDQPSYARQQYPQYAKQVQQIQRPQLDMDRHRPVNPQVVVLGGKSPMFGGRGNIMDQRNEFNETNKATIGFGR